MRVVFIGMNSPFSTPTLRGLAGHHHVVGVVESVVKDGRVRRASRIAEAAKTAGAPYHPLHFGDQTLASFLHSARPDAICVAGMARLLKTDEYAIARLGAINLHPTLLPNYRGPDPFFWQARATDLSGGVTVHQMDAHADTGDILAQEAFSIELGEPFQRLRDRVGAVGAGLMLRALDDLDAGQSRPIVQRELPCATPATKAAPSDWLIDWTSWPIERVWHFLRAAPDANPTLPPPPAAGHWSMGDMQHVAHGVPPGTIGHDSDGEFFGHPRGKIRVRFEPAAGVARRIVRRLMRTLMR